MSNIATHVFVSLQDLLTAEVLLEGLRRRLLVHGVASIGDATQHDNLVGAGFGIDSASHVYGGDNQRGSPLHVGGYDNIRDFVAVDFQLAPAHGIGDRNRTSDI
jgi:hypothetical protein